MNVLQSPFLPVENLNFHYDLSLIQRGGVHIHLRKPDNLPNLTSDQSFLTTNIGHAESKLPFLDIKTSSFIRSFI